MKKTAALLVIALILTGCAKGDSELERGMELRTKLLRASGVVFDAEITADYGDKLQQFSMSCQADGQGNVHFAVTDPQTIAGITGEIAEGSGVLTFEDTALHFELLTDEQLSPVSAPWILIKTLRSGYLKSAGMEEELLRLTIDDSYEEDALQLDVWLNEADVPLRAEILYDGKNILSLTVSSFQIL